MSRLLLNTPRMASALRPQVPRLSQRWIASGMTGSTALSDAIKKDHRELEQYYNEIINSTDHDHQERYGNQFTWELARHSVGEELVVYPAFEQYLGPDGKAMAESDRKEHHRVKELLKEFQNMKPGDPSYVPKIKELWTLLASHIREEESRDLPALEKALELKDDASESLAGSFSRTKMFVPSRSHPSAGEHPPFETVMGLLTAPMDKLADMFRKFPRQKGKGKSFNDKWL